MGRVSAVRRGVLFGAYQRTARLRALQWGSLVVRQEITIDAHEVARRLLGAACRLVGSVGPDDVIGPNRTANAQMVRQAVALTLRRLGWANPAIGIALNRDHSTVWQIVHKGECLATTDRSLARLVADLEAGVTEPESMATRMQTLEARVCELEALLTPHRRTKSA